MLELMGETRLRVDLVEMHKIKLKLVPDIVRVYIFGLIDVQQLLYLSKKL
jgi:hypothetical protein